MEIFKLTDNSISIEIKENGVVYCHDTSTTPPTSFISHLPTIMRAFIKDSLPELMKGGESYPSAIGELHRQP